MGEEAIHTPEQQTESLFSLGFEGFEGYFSNPEKSTGLFEEQGVLAREQQEDYRKQLAEVQANSCVLWQDVFSFDTTFLVEEGLYDPLTQQVQEERIYQDTQAAMRLAVCLHGMKSHLITRFDVLPMRYSVSKWNYEACHNG